MGTSYSATLDGSYSYPDDIYQMKVTTEVPRGASAQGRPRLGQTVAWPRPSSWTRW